MQKTENYAAEYLNTLNQDELIEDAETNYKEQLIDAVNLLVNGQNTIKFIFIGGPSSSGKTTSSHILKAELLKNRITAKVISLDDFFLERDETPLLPNGDKDYDSVNSIDWKLFGKCMSELLLNKSSVLPVYNFLTGEKNFGNTPTTLLDSEVIIIEGLHALNPIIANYIPQDLSIKIYVSPQTGFTYNNKVEIDGYILRLMRRLIRDIKSRGISPERTFKTWQNVRNAESKYIIPFMDSANFIIDTTHAYEPFMYKNILKTFSATHMDSINYLLKKLEYFSEMEPSKVPNDSLIKEFVG